MMSQDPQSLDNQQKTLAAKNTRLAIILALMAFGFYVGFILMYAF